MGLVSSNNAKSKRVRNIGLKLEAQKIKEFTGNFDMWQKWKSRTECAFDGSGYVKVLLDHIYAKNNTQMNRVVYAQLYVAMVDGMAHHLRKQHDVNKDDNAAWKSLCDWFDGDLIWNKTAETTRSRIEALKLHKGTMARDYVSR
jgi:hypothetical protein